MSCVVTVRTRTLGSETWVDCVRVAHFGERSVTFKLGQEITIKRGAGCAHSEGVIETLLNPSHVARFIVAIFPNGDRASFKPQEVSPKPKVSVSKRELHPLVLLETEPYL